VGEDWGGVVQEVGIRRGPLASMIMLGKEVELMTTNSKKKGKISNNKFSFRKYPR
jgi:hypothetical protein